MQNSPITTFEISANYLPDDLTAHYERLQMGAAYFQIAFPWETVESFIAEIQQQQCFLDSANTKSAVRITLVESNGQVLPVYEIRKFESDTVPKKLKLVTYERPHPSVKYNNYDYEARLLNEVQAEGFDDFLRVTSNGLISESRVANVFMQLQSDEWVTPDVETSCCLPGTARKRWLEAQPYIQVRPCPAEWLISGDVKAMFLSNALNPYQAVSGLAFNGAFIPFQSPQDVSIAL